MCAFGFATTARLRSDNHSGSFRATRVITSQVSVRYCVCPSHPLAFCFCRTGSVSYPHPTLRTTPAADVQAFMVHQSNTTTMRYIHHVPRHDAAAKLSAAFAGELTPVVGAADAS